MNTSTPSTTLLFAGESLSVTLIDKTSATVRVRTMELLDLFDVGREAELLEKCVQVATGGNGWAAVDANFVDNLSEESHLALVEKAKALNFQRAVSYGERQIANGQALQEMKKRIAGAMMTPIREELTSLMSSLTSQLSQAAAGKQP
jgi:hypothetical protein